MRVIKKFFRWSLSLPFSLLWLIFGLAGALSPLLRILSVVLTLLLIWSSWFKILLDIKDYGLFAAYVGMLLAMFFSSQLFGFLSKICEKIENKIRFGTPFDDPIYTQTASPSGINANNIGSQQITLTVDQLKELLNKES